MSYLWICLSLLYVATILQSSSINGGGSLKCNDTVEVVAGENVTLNCSIIYRTGNNCIGQQYHWRNSHGDIQCNSSLMKYSCGWDSLTYVYLTISNVIKGENYSLTILTDCGFADTSIKVRIKQDMTISAQSEPPKATEPLQSHSHVVTAILGTFVTIAVVGILYFLFGANRGRRIISCMKKGKDSRRRRQRSPESLTNSEICV